eukprot:g8499.t1
MLLRGNRVLFGPHHRFVTAPVSIRSSTSNKAISFGRHGGAKTHGMGKDAVGSWLDLSKLVTSDAAAHKSAFPDLAHDIGADVYVDINGWHLFLRDISISSKVELHTALAQQIAPDLLSEGFDRERIETVLKQVPLKIGGGKQSVALYDALPPYSVEELLQICEKFAEDN